MVAALWVEHLLHPEAGGRAVQQADEGKMIVFGRLRRQLDDRRRLLEDLAPAIEHEMVMRRDERKRDRQRCSELIYVMLQVFEPGPTRFFDSLAKHRTVSKECPESP